MTLRYAVVTSTRSGYAGHLVARAAPHAGRARLVAAVLVRGEASGGARRARLLRRKLRKAARIGIVGTANGIRMRRWFGRLLDERMRNPDLAEACRAGGVPLLEIASFADPAAHADVRSLDLDVAVSMGNGYIPRAFYSIPRLGMLNIHHELLPRYRGAQTVLWQLHDGSRVSGFSIHEITDRIDAGRILAREEVPIVLRPTLRDTVIETSAVIQMRSIDRLLGVLDRLEEHRAAALPNEGGRSYTTPSTGALVRIYRNFLRLRRSVGAAERR
jgi:methionyl-tRNA formyltransferase